MADNAQKTPVARALNEFAQRKALSIIQQTGRSLPASVVSRVGGIVTVKFEVQSVFTLPNVTVPMIGSEYVRLPIQAGCLGWVIPADAALGAMSGLGGGVADLSAPANLSALVWSPIGNRAWVASEDDEALVLYGPDGVVLRALSKTGTRIVLTPTSLDIYPPAGQPATVHGNLAVDGALLLAGSIESLAGGIYGGNIVTTGNIQGATVTGATEVVAGSGGAAVHLKTHHHSGVTVGGGSTGSPVGGT